MDHQLDRQIKFDPISPLQFLYENISVDATIEKQVPNSEGGYKKQKAVRTILKQCSGKFQPNTVTAILGPSGSGKTTMLNLLSGRLLSKNLTLKGSIKVNGKNVTTMGEYRGVIGYVMQEDLMLPTFTPRETFKFITDMRLPLKSEEEKNRLVQSMIESLGLTKCAETYVGNSLIRGLSGGEKKRTSIGVQLLINPSLIFLDEPTTGLDSTTALNLIRFLNRLAQAGRTVVTTIHQPSSEIFLQFDVILLMLDGNVVYHNRAADSMKYFSNSGMPVPIHTNPMDHYMKMMNKQGITLRLLDQGKQINDEDVAKQFQGKIKFLVSSYNAQKSFPKESIKNQIIKQDHEASWCYQMGMIFKRSVINQLRNPLGIRAKFFQALFLGIICIILYQKQSTSLDSYFQNLLGLLFFISTNISFSSIFGSINIFSQQRNVFIRQRLGNTYQTSSYFIGRSLAYLPLELFLSSIMISVCYFVVHFDKNGQNFFLTLVSCWLGMWMASAYGLFLSTAFKDAQVALTLVPVLIIPLMLVGGFFAPNQSVPDFFRIFQYISSFKYIYQAIAHAQFFNKRDGWTVNLYGKDYTYRGDILNNELYFSEPFWLSMFLMGIIGLLFRALSLLNMYLLTNPKLLRLKPAENNQNLAQQTKTHQIQTVKPLQSQLNKKQMGASQEKLVEKYYL